MPARRLHAALRLALAAPGSAAAHAILVDSKPAPQSHLPAGATDIVLRYNSRIDAARSKVTLTAPDGTATRLPAAAGATPDLLTAHAAFPAPGTWTLRWQVLATDGHITRGVVPFTVEPPTK